MAATISANLNRLTPSQTAEAIRFMRKTGVSFYIHGAPGISKSAVTRQIADELQIAFIDFRLSSVAPEDVRGVPFLDDVGGMKGLIWTPPLVFPRDLDLVGSVASKTGMENIRFYNPKGNNHIHYCKNPEIIVQCLDQGKTAEVIDKKLDRFVVAIKDAEGNVVPGNFVWNVTGKSEGILALEEFNSASPNVMCAAYQLILDRRVGDYIVPDGVMIVALGNRRGDKGLTYEIPKPVANRFDHIQMVVSFPDWQTWAIKNNVDATVLGFLSKWESELFDENFAQSPSESFKSPRSWEFVSKIVSQQPAPSDAVLKALVCGAIGDTTGVTFMEHRKFMSDMPDVRHIFDGSVTTFAVPKNSQYRTQIAYSTCVQMCYILKQEADAIDQKYKGFRPEIDKSPERKEWMTRANRAIGYAIDNFPPEVLIVLNRMAMQIYKLRFSSSHMSRFEEFCDLHADSILT